MQARGRESWAGTHTDADARPKRREGGQRIPGCVQRPPSQPLRVTLEKEWTALCWELGSSERRLQASQLRDQRWPGRVGSPTSETGFVGTGNSNRLGLS